MGDIVKLAVRLFIFAFVAAAALGITNEVTKGPIEAQKLAAKMEALSKVLPGDEYEQIEYKDLPEGSVLEEIFTGKNAAGEIDGYALTASPNGYGGPIPITIGVSTEGYVTQVYVGALQETAGLGSRVGEDEFMNRFVAIAADPDTLHDDVDTLSGATISSSAFLNAVDEMLTYTRDTLGITPKYGDKDAILATTATGLGDDEESVAPTNSYAVTGFAPFNVEISVDDAGKIVSVTVPEHNETAGFGADLIADQSVFDALVGQDIATAQIDVRSGATLTSNAINDALRQAAGGGETAESAIPGDPYTVKGMNKFTLYIEAEDGKIVSVTAGENSETPGLGADLLTEEALGILVGQDLATAQIDVKSGVTLTSEAINEALAHAAVANGVALPQAQPSEETNTDLQPTESPAPAQRAEEEEAEAEPKTAQKDQPTQTAQVSSEHTVYVKGYSPFKVEVALSADGKIVSVSVPENKETAGLGADLIADQSVFDALVGQDIATAQIDVKSGVTLTSEAINKALAHAAAEEVQ